MRPISGFERPVVQWLFVVLSVALIAAAGGAAWFGRRALGEANAARADAERGRLEDQQLDAQLSRERATREALTLELARQRSDGAEPARVMPTLTLAPAETRGPKPPDPTVVAQHATQIIELRLLLPPRVEKRYARFEIVLRNWTGGDAIWSRGGLTATMIDRKLAVATFLTGDVLRPGSYELLVSATTMAGQREEVASYEISVK